MTCFDEVTAYIIKGVDETGSVIFCCCFLKDLMDSDDLLAEEDLIKPDPASLRSECNLSLQKDRKLPLF